MPSKVAAVLFLAAAAVLGREPQISILVVGTTDTGGGEVEFAAALQASGPGSVDLSSPMS